MYLFDSERKTSIFYTILIMVLFTIPNYFAIKATIDTEHLKQRQALMEWVDEVKNSIITYDADLPRSVKYKIGLYDQNHNKIISQLENEPKDFSFETYVDYPYMYYQKNIPSNMHEVAYIVASVKINYSFIYIKAALLFLVILGIIYSFSRIMIRSSTIPYKQMQKYMDDFFNDAMHELKTPLGVIHINLELFSNITTPTKHIKRMKAATKQMQMTYDDVEYYIKNKKLKYAKEKINISNFLSNRITFFEDISLSKSIKINVNIEEDLYVFMNTTELQRLVDNTLSNAIKYSHFQGEIAVFLSKIKNDFCTLSIRDYGQGIKDTKAIFDRFNREDSVQGGFGLGLNIVQNICYKNDISIQIKSEESQGSTFIYTIPLDKVKFLDKAENEDN